ncbi:MAG TPA: CBS domain-containing protein [Terriglobales bacterium]|nr:CBS domain-containing protein [Terriglobales bacterium]
MLVREYMTTKVTTLPEDSRLLDAALIIRRSGKRHVPIVNSEGTVVGMVSDRDVARVAPSMLSRMTPEEYNQVFESTPINMVMSTNVITVSPSDEVSVAASLLYTKKIGALPVVEDGKLVGIVTGTDMLALLNELLGKTAASPASD